MLSQLREVRGKYEKRGDKAGVTLIDKTIAKIDSSTETSEMVEMNEFVASHG